MLFANTGLGLLWIVLQPLGIMVVITVVLGMFAKIPSGNIPYSALVLSGLVPWMYFSSSVVESCTSISSNANLISKVYFPRLILPVVPLVSGLVGLTILLLLSMAVALIYGFTPGLNWLFLPAPLVLCVLLALGFGLWTSALNVKYNDLSKFLPVLLQLGMYASPIFYPPTLVPSAFLKYYSLNPFVGVIISFRWSLFGGFPFPYHAFAVAVIEALFLIMTGVYVFRRMEDSFADIV